MIFLFYLFFSFC